MNVLLSIKPKYVDEILAGKKKFEFRKSIFKKRDISKVFIYSSSPVKKVVASFEIAGIIEASPQELWDKCHKLAGIPKQDFFDYFKNSDVGYAIEISNLEKLPEPIDPYDLKKDFSAPQSYCYLPLDYFETDSYPKTPEKKYETIVLAEENEEYRHGYGKTSQLKQSFEATEGRVGWASCSLNDVVNIHSGYGFPKNLQGKSNGKYPFYKVGDISKNVQAGNRYLVECANSIDEQELNQIKAKLYPENTVVFAKIGEALKLNRRAITTKPAIVDNNAIGIKAKETACLDLFLYYFSTRLKLEDYSRATTVPSVRKTDIEKIIFHLPPLPEQRAIVSKIEQLFSELDNGISNLKLAQEQLKVYRQAVLKKAFEGELTREWREQQTDLPDAEELLEQIRVEREESYNRKLDEWKRAVAEWEAGGKVGKKPTKPKKIKEPNPLTEGELNELGSLPSNWKWLKFGEACDKIFDGTHFSPKNQIEGDYKYITAKNIKEGRLDLSDISYVTHEDHSEIYFRCDVKKGDILYIKDGATTGKACVNPLKEEFSLLSSVGVFRVNEKSVYPKYVEHYLNAEVTRHRMLKNIAGVAITRLTLVKLNNSAFILPPHTEQQAIVTEIETRLSVCDKVEQEIEQNLEKAEALRQSILKKAFEGKLLDARELEEVRSAPDWEPAEVLLERIRAEKLSSK